jgi:PTS system fructose-specific IIC component
MRTGKLIQPGTHLFLADFTRESLMVPQLAGREAAAAIQELAAALHRHGEIPDLLQFYESALNREYLCNTVTDPGWAIPHATVSGLDRACFAVGHWTPPARWLKSSQPVGLVFLVAIPETDSRTYMTLVSGVARLSKAPELVRELLAATSASGMYGVLRRVRIHRDGPNSTVRQDT